MATTLEGSRMRENACRQGLDRRRLVPRRGFLVRGGVAALALTAGGCGALRGGTFVQPRVAEVAAGVYVVRGASGEFGPTNLGRVGNAGFIVDGDGVVAVDTGTSYRHGVALLDQIASVTRLPVRRVFVTHARQEFVFGAAAYRERGIPIHMHKQAAALMRARCEGCLKTLRSVLGEREMQHTAMFEPDAVFDDSHLIQVTGRPIRVLYFGASSGPGDIAVHDAKSGALFAGGLLDQGRIPDIADADLDGWRRALAALREMPAATIVPGHGPAGRGGDAIDQVERYLNALQARVTRMLEVGVGLSEVADRAALPEFAAWDQYTTIHRRNASVLYLRLESR